MVQSLFRLGGALPSTTLRSEPNDTSGSSYRQPGQQRRDLKSAEDMRGADCSEQNTRTWRGSKLPNRELSSAVERISSAAGAAGPLQRLVRCLVLFGALRTWNTLRLTALKYESIDFGFSRCREREWLAPWRRNHYGYRSNGLVHDRLSVFTSDEVAEARP